MEKKAYYQKRLNGFTGVAELYRMDPPLLGYDGVGYEFVVVSAARAPFSGPETYIFPADKEGNVTDWGGLPGSRRGVFDILAVLEDEGYIIEEKEIGNED